MKTIFSQNDFLKLLKSRNAFFILLILSLMANVAQGLLNYQQYGSSKTILIPLAAKESYWVTKNDVSATYLSEFARYAASLFLNVTPETIDFNQRKILEITSPGGNAGIKQYFLEEKEQIQKKKLNTAFYVKEVVPNTASLTIVLKGKLHSFIGDRPLTPADKSYEIRFDRSGTRLMIATFEEVPYE